MRLHRSYYTSTLHRKQSHQRNALPEGTFCFNFHTIPSEPLELLVSIFINQQFSQAYLIGINEQNTH
jgi:hypothetical protein